MSDPMHDKYSFTPHPGALGESRVSYSVTGSSRVFYNKVTVTIMRKRCANEVVRKAVSCPECFALKGKRCFRPLQVASKNPSRKKYTVAAIHEERVAKYKMFCEGT